MGATRTGNTDREKSERVGIARAQATATRAADKIKGMVMWTPFQEQRVQKHIADHPVATGRCADLARAVLPVARERDSEAHGLIVRANTAQTRYPCIKPRIAGLWWHHHVTVGVDAHCVDAVTGSGGTPEDVYLLTHFDNDLGDLRFDRRDPDLEDPCL